MNITVSYTVLYKHQTIASNNCRCYLMASKNKMYKNKMYNIRSSKSQNYITNCRHFNGFSIAKLSAVQPAKFTGYLHDI